MKNPPPSFGSRRPPQGMFDKSERNRLIFMALLLVVVVAVFATSLMKKSEYEREAREELPGAPEFEEQVVVQEFDPSRIQGQIADARPDDRVLIEAQPLEELFTFAREYGDNLFRAGKGEALDPAAYDALLAEPEAHRARPYRARGYVERQTTRTRPDGQTEVRGWLQLDDGRYVAFLLEALPDNFAPGDFLRVDGLFFKLYRGELEDEWVEGPFLVGRRAVRSYVAPPEEFDSARLGAALAQVRDDSFEAITKLDPAALDAQWLLMDYARRPEAEAEDWEAAPELSNEMLATLHASPEEYRGKPFRLPISRNMGSWTRDPGENPARLDALTTGWIANMTWTSATGLIQYVMPGAQPEARDSRYVIGRGYFLKKLAYEPRDGELALAPIFVLQSLEAFAPAQDESIDNVLLGVLGVTLFLILLIPVLLIRDRRKSEQLQRELVRRRQERRRRERDGEAQTHPS